MNAIQATVMQLALDAITLDAELQPRAEIDAATWQEYAQLLVDGHSLPPVLVVRDGERHWLVDGFHRWHAHKALGLAEIAAQVREGNALDALRASLRANAEHGKRREDADYRRGYQLAIKHQLVPPTDSEAVAHLLRCSVRWAADLTRSARERDRILKEEAIRARQAAGKSVREIAEDLKLPRSTVHDAVRKRKTAEPGHPIEADPDDPRQVDIEDVLAAQPPVSPVRAALAEYQDPQFIAWHKVLEALRVVNGLASVDRLFADRRRNFDHAIGPELTRARAWLEAFTEQYSND